MHRHDPENITPDLVEQIIDLLIENPMIDDACRELDISPMALKRARHLDEALDQDIEDAKEVGADRIEARAYARAMGHDEEQLMWQGKPVQRIDEEGNTIFLTKKLYSDRVLMAMLKAVKPEKYGEKSEITHKGEVGVLAVPEAMTEEAFSTLLNKVKAESAEEERLFEEKGIDAIYDTQPEPELDDLA